MAKAKLEPPPPQLAEPQARREAAETILKAYVAALGQNWLCCDIPIMQSAVLLARHELATEAT
jgi:hypothetical protein